MATAVTKAVDADERLRAEEARLAKAAAAGDGSAFATLYERYEGRAYNLAYRLTTSEEDAADAVQDAFIKVLKRLPSLDERELAFGSYLFTATRNCCYDLMQKRKRAEPSDAIPEGATPVTAAGGAFDPGDPADDGDRKLLVESQQDEIRAANARLPDRQREALALCELEGMSYDEIADVMDMNRNSVAQLISRARINLRRELKAESLAAFESTSPDCERALPLIAMDDDGQLEHGSEDATWLDLHLATCDTCKLGREAMQEAGASYRAWAPIAATPLLFRETMAKAAEAVGADWSDVIEEREAARGNGGSDGGASGVIGAISRHPVRNAIAAMVVAGALLLVGFETALHDDAPPTNSTPVVDSFTPETPAAAKAKKKATKKAKKKAKKKAVTNAAPATADTPADVPQTGNTQTFTPTQTGSGQQKQTTTKKKSTTPPTTSNPVDPVAPSDPPPAVSDPPATTEPPSTGRPGGSTGGGCRDANGQPVPC